MSNVFGGGIKTNINGKAYERKRNLAEIVSNIDGYELLPKDKYSWFVVQTDVFAKTGRSLYWYDNFSTWVLSFLGRTRC